MVGQIVARVERAKRAQERPGAVVGCVLLALLVYLICSGSAAAQDVIPIGQIQGRDGSSPYVDRHVTFRAVVTGALEDENANGTRFYTLFVQDVPGREDGDPLTSDGLAIFAGARRPDPAAGDIALFGGYVTEFYGLTEIDNNGLTYVIESRNNPLPTPVELDPPAENASASTYLERFEGMRVSLPVSTAVGPAHEGCGFSVVRKDSGSERILVRNDGDPAGQIIGVLHPSDVDCQDMPAVASGDEVSGLAGPLTYHFDRFKIIYQNASPPLHLPRERSSPEGPAAVEAGELVVATFNVNNYFDTVDDTGDDAEPKPSAAELALKQAKIVETIAGGLNCPDVLGLQEVENLDLLSALAAGLESRCDFVYQISHHDSPDGRGSDVALLTSPALMLVGEARLKQGCTKLDTGVHDPAADCPQGQQPLFSRPPLQVELTSEEQSLVVLVNHFKSKRGEAVETAARRSAQAEYVNGLVRELESADPGRLVIVMGDFNDYDGSPVKWALEGQDILLDGLPDIPDQDRYSYIFDGASQLIDWILVSPALSGMVVNSGILHSNADYPFQLGLSADASTLGLRSSDHDIPYIVIDTHAPEMPVETPLEGPAATAPSGPAAEPADQEQTAGTPSTSVGAKDEAGPENAAVGGHSTVLADGDVKLGTRAGEPAPTTPVATIAHASDEGNPAVAPGAIALVVLIVLVGGALALAATMRRRPRGD